MKGIYGYYDLKNEYWVYVGKDSDIGYDKRHSHHKSPKQKNKQQINKVIQNNPDRYQYFRLLEFKTNVSDTTLRKVEKLFVETLQTCKYDYPDKSCFNFEDICLKGQEGYWKGKTRSPENIEKISKSLKGRHISPETEFKKGHKPWNTGKKRPELSKEKHPNWKDYARIIKGGFNSSGKQVYKISYNGNKRIKTSINKQSLIKWFEENYPNIKLVDETKELKNE